MKIAFCADLHLDNHKLLGGEVRSGLNDRARSVLEVLDQAMALAAGEGAEVFVMAGDLFDQDRPIPQLIAAVQTVIARHDAMNTYLLVGNHERRSDALGDHALGPLKDHAAIIEAPRVVSFTRKGSVGLGILMVPWVSTTSALDSLQDALKKATATATIVCGHFGIIDEETPKWLQNASDGITIADLESVCGQHGITEVVTGHWHEHGKWAGEKLTAFQIGALSPTGWDNPGLTGYGTVVLFDSQTGEWSVKEVPGPRFLSFSDPSALSGSNLGNSIYARYTVSPSDVSQVMSMVEAAKCSGVLTDAVIVPSTRDAQVAARTAAVAARSADTLKDSVAGFVREMILPPNVDRSKVLGRSLKYLGKE